MSPVFVILGLVFSTGAALVHVAIFVLESLLWTRPTVWKRFGVRSPADALVIRPMALNQGFYNLFLGLGATVGVVLFGVTDLQQAGAAVVVFALLSMLLAATVLIVSNPKLARAAAIQGTLPLLGLAALALAAATG